MSAIADEPFVRWPASMTLRLARLGLTPMQILAVQVLGDLPEESPGVVWISATTLAKRLYAEATANRVRDAQRLLGSLVAGGYLRVAERPTQHRATRYDLSCLRAWAASVDVRDVFPKAAPPQACTPPAPKARTRRSKIAPVRAARAARPAKPAPVSTGHDPFALSPEDMKVFSDVRKKAAA